MTFVSLMAHELCHVVLHSMRHKERQNEFYTDLTAMMLGFAEAMKSGRKTVSSTTSGRTVRTVTTTYGYLSDSNFDFAYEKIESIWYAARVKQKQLLTMTNALERDFRRKKREVHYFRSYLAYLDRNLRSKFWKKSIAHDDGYLISTYHQADYTSDFEAALRKAESELKQNLIYIRNLSHYDEARFESVGKFEERMRSGGIDGKYDRIHGAVLLMKKYVPLTHRLRTFLKIKLGKW
jgi:hypothetical protein